MQEHTSTTGHDFNHAKRQDEIIDSLIAEALTIAAAEVGTPGMGNVANGHIKSNIADINAHLYALFAPGFAADYPDALIEIPYATPGDGDLNDCEHFSVFDLESAARFASDRNAAGFNVYVIPALLHAGTPPSRAADRYAIASRYAWIEYDAPGDAERIDALMKQHGLEAELIVTTGTVPNLRQHLYFNIRDSIADMAKLKAANTALRDLFGSDKVQNPARPMRLAGTVNHSSDDKRAKGYIVELTTLRSNASAPAYIADQLIALAVSGKSEPRDRFDFNQAPRQGETRRSADDLFELLQKSRIAGHWHNSMRDATACMVGRGWNDEQIRLACAPYCSGGVNDPDLDPLIEGARRKWNKPEPTAGNPAGASANDNQNNDDEKTAAGNPAPPPKINFIDVTAWHNQPVPERQWAVLDHVPLRQVTLLSGEGGVGKSILLLQALVAASISRDWIGSIPEPGPALYLGCEDEADELHRRLHNITDHYGVAFSQLKDLHPVSLAGEDATLARFDHFDRMEPTQLFKALYEQACDIKPKLIGLDTVSDIFAGNESNRTQVSKFVGLLRALAMASNSAVIVNSHPSLTGMSSGSGLSGSTGWHNRVRSRMYFRTPDANGGESDPDLRVLEFKKNQYGPLGGNVLLRWKNGVFVPEPTAGSYEQKLAESRAEHVFLTLLQRFVRERRNVNHKPGPSYAPKQFAEEAEAKAAKCNKSTLEAAMRRLLATKKIHLEPYGPKSKQDEGQCRFCIGPGDENDV